MERDMLTSASTVTMYAVCYYDHILLRTLWYDFTLEMWRETVTHTTDLGMAHTIRASVNNGVLVCVDIQATNARFI